MPMRWLGARKAFTLSLLIAACARGGSTPVRVAEPAAVVNELLAADRGFSAAAARTESVAAITAMLADDVAMPTPRGQFARGRSGVADALRPALGRAGARARWTPIRGGISADGQHGFTFGYMTVQVPDTESIPLKYLAYWVKRPHGWRVAAYNVRRRAPGDVPLAMMAPSLPASPVRATTDSATIARYHDSLVAAERAFSDRAQKIGLGPAFAEYGSADAVNMGGRDSRSFIVGSEAIGRMIGAGSPQPTSPVSWSADRALVASSGDLGVTFGMIRPNALPADGARAVGFPFFTIWRRSRPTDPWRYVAE
jgi:ketosteroid isomerase-like protein